VHAAQVDDAVLQSEPLGVHGQPCTVTMASRGVDSEGVVLNGENREILP
jgi:hypothetical protein